MNILKQIFTYLVWIVLALLSGIGYMRILLGPEKKPSTGILHMFDWVHSYVMVYVGTIIGSVIALLFILLDIFYLRKKLKNHIKATIIRFLLLFVLTIVVGATHYILEKVVDII